LTLPITFAPSALTSKLLNIHVLFIFYDEYRPNLHLPSFPTRRSSDLADCVRYGRRYLKAIPMGDAADAHDVVAAHPAAIGFQITDRKSTRLNSSHVEISYAVFCLKKKKSLVLVTPSIYTRTASMLNIN